MSERITYARATHGEEEIQAVVDVLRSGTWQSSCLDCLREARSSRRR